MSSPQPTRWDDTPIHTQEPADTESLMIGVNNTGRRLFITRLRSWVQGLIDAAITAAGGGGVAPQQRVLRDVSPSAATLQSFIFNGAQPEITEQYTVAQGTPQTAVFRNYADANYIGVLSRSPDPELYRVGQWYYSRFAGRPYVCTDRDPVTPGVQLGFQPAAFGEVVPGFTSFLRSLFDDDEAAPLVSQARDAGAGVVGTLFYDISTASLRECIGITAGTGPVQAYRPRRLLDSHDLALVEDQGRRLALVERGTADMEHVDVELRANDAPAAEMSFATFGEDTAYAEYLAGRARGTFDPATIPGGTAWRTRAIVEGVQVLIRLGANLQRTLYSYDKAGVRRGMAGESIIGQDDAYIYVNGGSVGAQAQFLVLKYSAAYQTAYHGELRGRALAQARESSGLPPDAAAKLGRYASNPAANPAGTLAPFVLVQPYISAAYVQAEFAGHDVDDGEVMISPGTAVDPAHRLLIGLVDADLEAAAYAAPGLTLRAVDAGDGSVYLAGVIEAASMAAVGKLLLTMAVAGTVQNSTPDGSMIRLEISNAIGQVLSSARQAIEAEATAREQADAAIRESVGATTDYSVDPPYWLNTADARTLVVHLNREWPTVATRIRMTLGGTPITIDLVESDTDYAFDITGTAAANVRNNLRGATTLRIDLQYLDAAGDEVVIRHTLLRVLDEVPGAASVKADHVIAAPADLPASAGGARPSADRTNPISLPANFANWKYLDVCPYIVDAGTVYYVGGISRWPTALLAAQNGNIKLALMGDIDSGTATGARTQDVFIQGTWNPTARTLTSGAGRWTDSVYAVLTDG